MRINFVLPPSPTISGGPLAILEYANRFIDLGHTVTITTYPDCMWQGDNPFPWFNFKGEIRYKHFRNLDKSQGGLNLDLSHPGGLRDVSDEIIRAFGLGGLRSLIVGSGATPKEPMPFDFMQTELLTWLHVMEVMPECDLNIATFWSTVFPVYYSFKGKPVFFMQHYEEVFYPLLPHLMLHKLMARLAYEMPVYKVANSSWLQKLVKERFNQTVPFSNNAIEVSDFAPRPKLSEDDGTIRIITYARPEEWKGFSDAVACMAAVRQRVKTPIEWNVFGYKHPHLVENNEYAPYTYHPKLSFAALSKLYATSDIAICPSWYESFPLPPLEAMASGTATVTTAAGTEDYAFHENNALVVQSRDVSAMADAVCRLIEDKALRDRLAAEGRKTAEKYEWDRAVKDREAILTDIFEGRVAYDVDASAKLGLSDVHGIAFESGPVEAQIVGDGLLWHAGALYLIYDGAKRHVLEGELIPRLLENGFQYIEVDGLLFARLPHGGPLSEIKDVPLRREVRENNKASGGRL